MENINDSVDVSIAMVTYNHEKFIAQAIESVLMQKVTFKYEIIIGDDCSLDRTQIIIQEYSKKYPDKITAILRKKNIGAQKNSDDVKKRCRGKYLIILEGDDYWTDPNKLQIQYDFLESHPEYYAVSHWCDVVDENGNITNEFAHKYYILNFKKTDYLYKDYQKDRIPGHMNTILFRNFYLRQDYNYEKIFSANDIIGDRTLFLILVMFGKVYVIHKIMSHYRYIKKEGYTNFNSSRIGKNDALILYNYYECLERYIYEEMGRRISLRHLRYQAFLSSIKKYIFNSHRKENKFIVDKILKKLNKKEMALYLVFEIFLNVRNYIIRKVSD